MKRTRLRLFGDSATRARSIHTLACAGLLGWFEYQWNVKLSQEINHRLRSRLFARVQRPPMVQLDDQRIGDAIYRLMYGSASLMAQEGSAYRAFVALQAGT